MFEEFNGADESLIKKLESKINFKLPYDYTDFLLRTNGGVFKDFMHSFAIENNNEQIQMDSLFGFKEERSLNLLSWFNEYESELPECTLIIGTTYGAGLIIMNCDNKTKGIYLWDDGLELEQSTEESCTYKIAENFNDFINKIITV